MPTDLRDWAKKHLDDGMLKNDIMYPSAELDLVVKEPLYQAQNRKAGLITFTCPGYNWDMWLPVCTQTSGLVKWRFEDSSKAPHLHRLVSLPITSVEPYILDRVLWYFLSLRVDIPDVKRITSADFARHEDEIHMSTLMVLVKMYDAAGYFQDFLLKSIVLAHIRQRLSKEQCGKSEFWEALREVGRHKQSPQHTELNNIFLTAAILRNQNFASSVMFQQEFLDAQSDVFKDRYIIGLTWYHNVYRKWRDDRSGNQEATRSQES